MPKRKAEAEAPPGSDKGKSFFETKLRSYIKAGYPAIYIVSHEEQRVHLIFSELAKELEFTLHSWSYTKGLKNITDDTEIADTADPLAVLGAAVKLPEKSIILLNDYHQFLAEGNPMLTRAFKDALAVGKMSNRVLVVIGCQLKIPPELEKSIVVVEFSLPSREQLRIVLEGIATSAGITINGNTDAILDAASGLTCQESEDAFALSVVECGDIKAEIVAKEKAGTVKKNGILEIMETTAKVEDIGGLEILKSWLSKRRLAFGKEAREYGLPVPKGVLAIGLPGSGKSLTAKAAASILGVPLLKLDGGKLFAGHVGESEANMRSVIQTAEAVAPCVLFVDELEKAFAGSKSSGSTDGGTSARVFGTFLQWMNDKTAQVFVFATANSVSDLPPEFLRKGRFDELFFCDLPDADERAAIWRVHLNKRKRDADKFNLEMLASRTEGFVGAEIEAAVNEALFAAFDDSQAQLTDEHLLDAVRNTVPLSRTMAPQIDALRAWATGRARRASAIKEPQKGARKLA